MSGSDTNFDFDVVIVGGGPAGLSAAIVLARALREVGLFDHGKPRNAKAEAVHGYLGHDGIDPHDLRQRGRREAARYGVRMIDAEVTAARCLSERRNRTAFEVQTAGQSFIARTLLLATGVVDELPDIPNLREYYGRSVHHCPYCDGWEHRGQQLAAIGDGASAAKLALSLRTWSPHVTACFDGHEPDRGDRERLARNGIVFRKEAVARLAGEGGVLTEIVFESGPPLRCDALFFSAGMGQRSPLAAMLGCERDAKDMVQTGKKQESGITGLFFAGDSDGDVQFAIVAAAEGSTAATAINTLLQEQDRL